ncbi:MAG: amidohydrolase family protein [Oscillospiraceae bacterium]|nr:amidohydrolase family protein [Oscillospiraceae bacterium]
MKKIAIEEHFATARMLKDMKTWEKRLEMPSIMGKDFVEHKLSRIDLPPEEHRLPEMDRFGVDMQVISANWPAAQGYIDEDVAVQAAQEYNDAANAIVQAHPDRFRAFATLPLQDPDRAVKELERCVNQLGFVGVMIQGHSNLEYLDDIRFDGVWSALEEMDVPLYLHVGHPEHSQLKSYGSYTEMMGPTWNWAAEGTTHTLRLVFGGVFERHPKAKLILGHLGETIPYLLRRIDEGADKTGAMEKGIITHEPSFYLKRNLYITTSGEYFPEALHCAVSAMGLDHVLFACDYPLSGIDVGVECLERCGLTEDELDTIYHVNAERLVHLG